MNRTRIAPGQHRRHRDLARRDPADSDIAHLLSLVVIVCKAATADSGGTSRTSRRPVFYFCHSLDCAGVTASRTRWTASKGPLSQAPPTTTISISVRTSVGVRQRAVEIMQQLGSETETISDQRTKKSCSNCATLCKTATTFSLHACSTMPLSRSRCPALNQPHG